MLKNELKVVYPFDYIKVHFKNVLNLRKGSEQDMIIKCLIK